MIFGPFWVILWILDVTKGVKILEFRIFDFIIGFPSQKTLPTLISRSKQSFYYVLYVFNWNFKDFYAFLTIWRHIWRHNRPNFQKFAHLTTGACLSPIKTYTRRKLGLETDISTHNSPFTCLNPYFWPIFHKNTPRIRNQPELFFVGLIIDKMVISRRVICQRVNKNCANRLLRKKWFFHHV